MLSLNKLKLIQTTIKNNKPFTEIINPSTTEIKIRRYIDIILDLQVNAENIPYKSQYKEFIEQNADVHPLQKYSTILYMRNNLYFTIIHMQWTLITTDKNIDQSLINKFKNDTFTEDDIDNMWNNKDKYLFILMFWADQKTTYNRKNVTDYVENFIEDEDVKKLIAPLKLRIYNGKIIDYENYNIFVNKIDAQYLTNPIIVKLLDSNKVKDDSVIKK